MSDLKMSDVFNGHKVIADADSLIVDTHCELADFSGYKKECRYVAHAINSYDSMAEKIASQQKEIAEYRSVFASMSELVNKQGWDSSYFDDLLEKHNKG